MRKNDKFERWCKHFLDPKSPTKGNATQSALAVYGSKNYHTAGAIGHQNYKKLQLTGLAFVEEDGLSVKELWRIAAAKAVKGSYEQTIDFMQRLGIIDKDNANGNQLYQQFNFGDLAEQFTRARQERGLPVD